MTLRPTGAPARSPPRTSGPHKPTALRPERRARRSALGIADSQDDRFFFGEAFAAFLSAASFASRSDLSRAVLSSTARA